MQITPFVDALQRDLAAVAAAGDAEANEIVRRFSTALDSSARLRLLEAVSEAASELTAQLPGGRVEVRLAGSDPALVYVEETRPPAPGVEDGLTARISLRLPETLKAGIESAAARDGVSVNSWIVQALGRGVEERPRRAGRRLSGYARS
jgi:hypothetical protein